MYISAHKGMIITWGVPYENCIVKFTPIKNKL